MSDYINYHMLVTDLKMNILKSNSKLEGNLFNYIAKSCYDDFQDYVNQLKDSIILFDCFMYYENAYLPVVIKFEPFEDKVKVDIVNKFKFELKRDSKPLLYILKYSSKKEKILSIEEDFKILYLNICPSDLFQEDMLDFRISNDYTIQFTEFLNKIKHQLSSQYIKLDYLDGSSKWVLFKNETNSHIDEDIIYIQVVDYSYDYNNQNDAINMSSRDQLTGCMLKSSIRQYIEGYMRVHKDQQGILSIIDIDEFKSVNDTYGHLFGDIVLKTVAKIFLNSISAYRDSRVGRIGGDEFLLFVPGIFARDDIKNLSYTIRKKINELEFPEARSLYTSITAGIVRFPSDGSNYETLIMKADKALYRGKQKGRDCYIIYDEQMHGKIDDTTVLNVSQTHEILEMDNKIYQMSSHVFDFMQSKNLKESLNTLIMNLCNVFNIDRVVLHYNTPEFSINEFYMGQNGVKVDLSQISEDEFELAQIDLNIRGYISVCNTNLIFRKNPNLHQLFLKLSTFAFVLFAIDHQDPKKGFISFEMNSKKRLWNKREIEFFNFFTMLIFRRISEK